MNSFVSVNVFQNIHYYSFRILNCFWGYISVINDGKCCISYRQNVMEIPIEWAIVGCGSFSLVCCLFGILWPSAWLSWPLFWSNSLNEVVLLLLKCCPTISLTHPCAPHATAISKCTSTPTNNVHSSLLFHFPHSQVIII